MIVRELERVLVACGADASPLDVVTRQLRECGALPIGGRGKHAPQIGPQEAASVLLSYVATASVAGAVPTALLRMKDLARPQKMPARHGSSFVNVVATLLGDPAAAAEIEEVRVCRNMPLADIVYADRAVERFMGRSLAWERASEYGRDSLRSEGVIAGGVFRRVAAALASWEAATAPAIDERVA